MVLYLLVVFGVAMFCEMPMFVVKLTHGYNSIPKKTNEPTNDLIDI